MLNIYPQGLILGVLAHLYSPFWGLKKVLGSNPVVCSWNSTNPLQMNLIWEGCQWGACQVGSAVVLQKRKIKYAIYIQGFPRP